MKDGPNFFDEFYKTLDMHTQDILFDFSSVLGSPLVQQTNHIPLPGAQEENAQANDDIDNDEQIQDEDLDEDKAPDHHLNKDNTPANPNPPDNSESTPKRKANPYMMNIKMGRNNALKGTSQPSISQLMSKGKSHAEASAYCAGDTEYRKSPFIQSLRAIMHAADNSASRYFKMSHEISLELIENMKSQMEKRHRYTGIAHTAMISGYYITPYTLLIKRFPNTLQNPEFYQNAKLAVLNSISIKDACAGKQRDIKYHKTLKLLRSLIPAPTTADNDEYIRLFNYFSEQIKLNENGIINNIAPIRKPHDANTDANTDAAPVENNDQEKAPAQPNTSTTNNSSNPTSRLATSKKKRPATIPKTKLNLVDRIISADPACQKPSDIFSAPAPHENNPVQIRRNLLRIIGWTHRSFMIYFPVLDKNISLETIHETKEMLVNKTKYTGLKLLALTTAYYNIAYIYLFKQHPEMLKNAELVEQVKQNVTQLLSLKDACHDHIRHIKYHHTSILVPQLFKNSDQKYAEEYTRLFTQYSAEIKNQESANNNANNNSDNDKIDSNNANNSNIDSNNANTTGSHKRRLEELTTQPHKRRKTNTELPIAPPAPTYLTQYPATQTVAVKPSAGPNSINQSDNMLEELLEDMFCVRYLGF